MNTDRNYLIELANELKSLRLGLSAGHSEVEIIQRFAREMSSGSVAECSTISHRDQSLDRKQGLSTGTMT